MENREYAIMKDNNNESEENKKVLWLKISAFIFVFIIMILVIINIIFFSYLIIKNKQMVNLAVNTMAALIAGFIAVFISFVISQIFYQNSNIPISDILSIFNFNKIKGLFKSNANLLPTSETKHYYKVGSIFNGEQLIEEFEKNKVIAIGWKEFGNLKQYTNPNVSEVKFKQEINDKFSKLTESGNEYYANMSATYKGQITGFFIKLLKMKKGDIIVIPDYKKLIFLR